MARYIALLVLAVLAQLLATPVASYASNSNGNLHSVPEPSTLTLLGVGAGAMGVVAWVRARRKK